MTPEEHVELIISDFAKQATKKYMKGQEEHGGRLWRKNCLPFMFEEVIDFYVYMHVVNAQLVEMKYLLKNAIALKDWELVEAAYNLLTMGNKEGVPEEEK
jgi:hypothetical protein